MNESSKNTPFGRETMRLELSDNKRKTLIANLEDIENMEDIDHDQSLPFLLDPDPDNEPTQEISFEKNYNISPKKEEHTSQEQSFLSKPDENTYPTNTTKMHQQIPKML